MYVCVYVYIYIIYHDLLFLSQGAKQPAMYWARSQCLCVCVCVILTECKRGFKPCAAQGLRE